MGSLAIGLALSHTHNRRPSMTRAPATVGQVNQGCLRDILEDRQMQGRREERVLANRRSQGGGVFHARGLA